VFTETDLQDRRTAQIAHENATAEEREEESLDQAGADSAAELNRSPSMNRATFLSAIGPAAPA